MRNEGSKMRDWVYLFAGETGLSLLEATAKWLTDLIPSSPKGDKLVTLTSLWRGTVKNVELSLIHILTLPTKRIV